MKSGHFIIQRSHIFLESSSEASVDDLLAWAGLQPARVLRTTCWHGRFRLRRRWDPQHRHQTLRTLVVPHTLHRPPGAEPRTLRVPSTGHRVLSLLKTRLVGPWQQQLTLWVGTVHPRRTPAAGSCNGQDGSGCHHLLSTDSPLKVSAVIICAAKA